MNEVLETNTIFCETNCIYVCKEPESFMVSDELGRYNCRVKANC